MTIVQWIGATSILLILIAVVSMEVRRYNRNKNWWPYDQEQPKHRHFWGHR